ncbi:MAG: ABC transporter ATP-binding protein [Patescibacteria group bacterium]|mgnify:CR=1 FL=1
MNILKTPHLIRVILRGFRPYRRELSALVALGFLGGVLEGIGINALIPFLGFILGDVPETSGLIMEAVRSLFELFQTDLSLRILFFLIGGLFILKAFVLLAFQVVSASITSEYERRERERLFGSMLGADWLFLSREKMGYLDKALTLDITGATNLLRVVSMLILSLTNLCIYSIVAFSISSRITLIALIAGAIFFLTFKPIFRKTAKTARRFAEDNKRVGHFVNQIFLGIKSIKTRAVPAELTKQANHLFESLKHSRRRLYIFHGLGTIFAQPIVIIFLLALFGIMYRQPGFTFSVFAVMVYLVHQIFSYIEGTLGKLQKVSELLPHLESSIASQKLAQEHVTTDHGTNTFLFEKEIRAEQIEFSYPKNGAALRGLSFSVKKGELLGIIGPSGSGKTTLINLFLRLLTPTRGALLVDGVDSRTITREAWRQNVGYVPQDLFLLNGTITENIRFFDPTVTAADVARAIDLAQANEFVSRLPEQSEAQVGEQGINLSMGQRQRIVLARALAKHPEVLILDEATSALDNASQEQLKRVIESMKGSTTTIIMVAHRLSTLSMADRILAIVDGQIVEEGAPADLLRKPDSYFSRMAAIE